MKLDLGSLVRHSTGVVGAVEKVYAAGEHPSATCEVVRLSTGDELVLKPEEFELLGDEKVFAFYRDHVQLTVGFTVAAVMKQAELAGVSDRRLVTSLIRSALVEALRPAPKKN